MRPNEQGDTQVTYTKVRRRVLARDGWRRQACGAREHIEVHHQHFRSHGGSNNDDNLVTLCFVCHRQLHESPTVSPSSNE